MENNSSINPHQVHGDDQTRDGINIKTQCQMYMNYHVIGQLKNGLQIEGIITGADEDGVTMLVPEDVGEEQDNRQFGFGYDDDYNDYGRPRRRYRRYRRRRYPYFYFVFPYFRPYPYYPWY